MDFYDSSATALSSESPPTEFDLSSWERARIDIYSEFGEFATETYGILMDIESITRVY